MMTLNNNEKDFQEKLQKDTEMPAIVHERINQAYRLIENNAVLQKKARKAPFPCLPQEIYFFLVPIRFNRVGPEGFQRATGKPFGRLRRGETPAQHAKAV